MHTAVLDAAAIAILLLVAACIVMILRQRAAVVRIILLDLATVLLVGVLIIRSAAEGVSHFVDAALVLALISFASTVAASRFLGWGRIFE